MTLFLRFIITDDIFIFTFYHYWLYFFLRYIIVDDTIFKFVYYILAIDNIVDNKKNKKDINSFSNHWKNLIFYLMLPHKV